MNVERMVEQIREWELDAGESFTDYFLDGYSYNGAWLEFLESKGFHDLVEEIKEDVYVLSTGHVIVCTDQQLKFEPHSSAHEAAGGDWDEDIYCKDVALWAEFILKDADIMAAFGEFMEG